MGSTLITRKELLASGLVRVLEKAIIEGATPEEAAAAAGISKRQFARWKTIPEILEILSRAKVSSKLGLVRAARKIATQGSVVKEIKEVKRPVTLEDGTKLLETTEIVEYTREIPPDGKVAIALLKAEYPEDYGDVRRLDMKKVGSAKQIDLESTPEKMKDPKNVLDMILTGDGSYAMSVLDDGEQFEIPEEIESEEEF